MLTRIRNAVARQAHARRHAGVALKVEIARILESEGYIQGFKVVDATRPARSRAAAVPEIRPARRARHHRLERVSRPGRRVYFGRDEVPDVLAGLGTSILTTSRGVMTGREAVKAGVGGEVLCNVVVSSGQFQLPAAGGTKPFEALQEAGS